MLLSAALVPLLLLSTSATASSSSSSGATMHHRRGTNTPHARSYDTHLYYALELRDSADGSEARSAAAALGVELVEPLGELAGHWLVRRTHDQVKRRALGLDASAAADPVVERFHQLRSNYQTTPGGSLRRDTESYPSLRSIEIMEPRQRVKRQYPPPVPVPNRRSRKRGLNDMFLDDEEPRDETELLFIQNDIGLKDPLIPKQWHFANQVDSEWELNVTGLWHQGITGKGVKVVIVDDGLDLTHEDIAPNYFAEGSWDFNNHGASPAPRLSDDKHGTRCAGEVAAAPNDVCGVGVAYSANIAGVRILSEPITDADEAEALNFKYQENDIFSCSWGPPDDGKSMEAPNGLILKSLVNGVQKGRGGKGSLFVFAAGNGGDSGDQCNFDGYTNSIFSVTVGAVDHTGKHPFYSERCSAMMIVAPSSGSGNHIHTTDVGSGMCSSSHGGTSAAAPLMAGVLALALQVRPDLTWRDVQHIAVNNAVMLHKDDDSWETTTSGRKYSYKYGYGRIDAHKYVDAARTWKLVKPQAWYDSPAQHLPYTPAPVTAAAGSAPAKRQQGTPDTTAGSDITITPTPEDEGSFITADGVSSSYEVTDKMLADNNFARLEHVTIRVWIDHQRRGDVEVSLESPNGVVSMLAEARRLDEATTGFDGWKFMTLKHWEENPVGKWVITVKDAANPESTGRFKKWSMQLWGEVADENDAPLWSPAAAGEIDEEETGSPTPTPIPQKPKPTALLPTEHGGSLPESLQTSGAFATAPHGSAETDDKPDTHASADEGVFDGIDTLRKHSTWLGGAILIVLIAALGVGGFFLVRQRRRRARLMGMSGGEASRGNYAPVADDDVPMSLMERGRRAVGMGHKERDGGEESKELYDAFGDGPSDSEDEEDREGLRYHDDFLADDDEHHHPHASGSGRRSVEADPEKRSLGGDVTPPRLQTPSHDDLVGAGESNTSSGSWQDAADDVRQ